jgi:type II protein arginine methyltransferase
MTKGAHHKAALSLEAMVAMAEGDPRRLAMAANFAATLGRSEDAYRLARQARNAAPGDAEIAGLTQAPMTHGVPDWHFRIVRDTRRNDLYEAAIRRAVKPGMRVLDIGAGTGLLAMMAARAGAAEVISCEMNPAVADAAAEIVALNGFADRVRVIPRRSTQLDPIADLGGPVDLLVSEIVSNDLLKQNVLPVMEHAVARLLKPGGRMIPGRGSILVALAELPRCDEKRLGTVSGFDLSPFNRLMQSPLPVKPRDRPQLRSEPVVLFDFDFTRGGAWPAPDARGTLIAGGGRVNGLLQWMRIDLDEVTRYEVDRDPGAPPAWGPLFFPLDTAITPEAGAAVGVRGVHDRVRVRSWIGQAD